MEALGALEQKIKMLVGLVTDLKENNSKLKTDNDSLRAELDTTRHEVSRLAAENKQLLTEYNALESSLLKGTETIHELSEERSFTLSVVDDLLKSIDSLAEQTNHV